MPPRFLCLLALLSGCACGPISHTADVLLPDASMGDAPEPMADAPDAGAPDAGPPRFPPLPECPLQPGQTYLPGAGSPEGTMTTLPGSVHSAAFGGDVAAFLHEGPWRVTEARADRTPLFYEAFEPVEVEPFRSDVSLSVAGDGTIWLTRVDWRSLDDHGRSLELIGRQIISIYCGVRTVELFLGERDLDPVYRVIEDGVPIPTPDGATLIDLPGRGVIRSFVGTSEPFAGAGESLANTWSVGGRLLVDLEREGGGRYLVEYDGAPAGTEDVLLEDASFFRWHEGDAPMFCGGTRAGSAVWAPTPEGVDEWVTLEGPCFDAGWIQDGVRWLWRRPPAGGAGYYRWDDGEAPSLRVPLTEDLGDVTMVPFSGGGLLVHYVSDTVPRYRVRYVDPTQSNDLGAFDTTWSEGRIAIGPERAFFVTGTTLVSLTETERVEQTFDGLRLSLAGVAPDGAAWVSERTRNDLPLDRSRLLRVMPPETTVVLDPIESASFTWQDGVGFGQVFAYGEGTDARGFYFVERASGLRRIGQSGSAVPELRAIEGHTWLLHDGTLGRLVDGMLRDELEEVGEIEAVLRDLAGRIWLVSRRPTPDGYWTTRLARVSTGSVEVIHEVRGSDVRPIDAGIERDFARVPWGVVLGSTEDTVRLCPYVAPRDCIPLPGLSFQPVVTASGRLFSWSGGTETTLLSRTLR